MAYLIDLTNYKNRVMEILLSDKKIVSLITNKDISDDDLPAKELAYSRVYPYDFIPDTATEQCMYICFDVDVIGTPTEYTSEVALYVYFICHKEYLRIPGVGIRTDLTAGRIDELINGQLGWGFDRIELQKCTRFNPGVDFEGRVLKYTGRVRNRVNDRI